jgi:tetratricopeptide (TPR) repeat protein
VDPTTKEPLDDRLIRDIDRPDLLPIVQFVLDRLFQQRALGPDGSVTLTHAAYQALGTLNGAIDTAAEAAIAPLGPAAIAALPRLLRALVLYTAPSAGAVLATPALRQAPVATIAHDDISRRLLTALIDARILVSGRDHADNPVVGLAHQRVIEAWGRARDAITESADLLRVREDIEDARRRYEGAGRRNDLLIPPGLKLSEAEHAAAALKDELSPETLAFVDKSARSSRLRQRLTAAAAVIFLTLAVGAGFLGVVAQKEKVRAEQAADEAKQQSRVAEEARAQAEQQRQQAETARRQADAQRQQADTARKQAELGLAAADELLEGDSKAEQLRQCLASTARAGQQPAPRGSRDYFVGRWHVDQGGGQRFISTDMDWLADGTCKSNSFFSGGVRVLEMKSDVCTWSFSQNSDNEFLIDYQSVKLGKGQLRFRIVSPTRIHNIDQNYDAFRIVCPQQELEFYRKDLAALQERADGSSDNVTYQHDLAEGHEKIGDILSSQADYRAALEEYAKAVVIRRKLALSDESNKAWQRDLAYSYTRVGDTSLILKDNDAAAQAHRSSLLIRDKLYQASRKDFTTQHDLAAGLERIAGILKILDKDKKTIHAAYRRAMQLREGLAAANPNNAILSMEAVLSLYFVSTVSDAPEVKDTLTKALAITTRLESEQRLPQEFAQWPAFLRAELAKVP